MPKHALGPTPTREKLFGPPNVGSSSSSSSFMLSNEVLLRSKIAQLESKGKAPVASKPRVTTGNGAGNSKCAGIGKGRRISNTTIGTNSKMGCPSGKEAPKRHGGGGVESHGSVSGRPSAESQIAVLQRFEAEVALERENATFDEAPQESEGQDKCHYFLPERSKSLKGMYSEQVRMTRMMSKQAEVLLRKTQELERSNEIMRSETEHCTREIARLEHAAAKLHSLSVELDGRRSTLLENRTKEAEEEAIKREDMNASWNAVVNDISAKIKDQEEERIAQDEENASLRAKLHALLVEYDENQKASVQALDIQEKEQAMLTKRLEGLEAATGASVRMENVAKKDLEELTVAEDIQQVLQRRIHEHGNRLKRQEVGLKVSLEAVERLRADEASLTACVTSLTYEKKALLGRIRGDDGLGMRGEDVKEVDLVAPEAVDMDNLQLMVKEAARKMEELELEKRQWQTRCRELQAERTKLTKEAELLIEIAARTNQHTPRVDVQDNIEVASSSDVATR